MFFRFLLIIIFIPFAQAMNRAPLFPYRELTYDSPLESLDVKVFVPHFSQSKNKFTALYRDYCDDWQWMCESVDSSACFCDQVFNRTMIGLTGCTVGPTSPLFPDACVRQSLASCGIEFTRRSQDGSLRLVGLRVLSFLVSGCFIFA